MTNAEMDFKVPKITLILVAIAQGLALFLLDQFIETRYGLHHPDSWLAYLYSPKWMLSLYAFTLAFPTFLILSLHSVKEKRLMLSGLFYSGLVFLLCFYTGNQYSTFANYYEAAFSAALSLGISCFVVLAYIQNFFSQKPLKFETVHALMQNNLLIAMIAWLFLGIVWAVLGIWAALFSIINIDFFKELFTQDSFIYLASTVSFAIGVIITRQQLLQTQFINRIQQVLARLLLIVLSSFAFVFLIALIFQGFTPLWDNGGSVLILSVQALILVFINITYQDEYSEKHSVYVHGMITLSLVIMPIYSLISLYGLSDRIGQYGWSVSRAWALFIWLMLALFMFGYLYQIIRHRFSWHLHLSRFNLFMGIVLILGLLLVNSPLINFQRISANSQLARLQQGDIELEYMDFRYLKTLGIAGEDALKELKMRAQTENNTKVVIQINKLLNDQAKTLDNDESEPQSKSQILANIKGDADIKNLPEGLSELIYKKLRDSYSLREKNEDADYLFSINLDQDDQPEYLLVSDTGYRLSFDLYFLEKQVWKTRSMRLDKMEGYGNANERDAAKAAKIDALLNKQYQTIQPRWQQLEINGQRLQVLE